MEIQTEILQPKVSIEFLPHGSDMPYRFFISEDPIGFQGGDVNLYAYVGNNPILLFDPFGLRESSSNSTIASLYGGGQHGLVSLATNGPTDSSYMRQRELTGEQWAAYVGVGLGAPAAVAGGAVFAESAAGVAAINWALSNPAAVTVIQQNAGEFIQGMMPGTPPPTPMGYAGAGTVWAIQELLDLSQ